MLACLPARRLAADDDVFSLLFSCGLPGRLHCPDERGSLVPHRVRACPPRPRRRRVSVIVERQHGVEPGGLRRPTGCRLDRLAARRGQGQERHTASDDDDDDDRLRRMRGSKSSPFRRGSSNSPSTGSSLGRTATIRRRGSSRRGSCGKGWCANESPGRRHRQQQQRRRLASSLLVARRDSSLARASGRFGTAAAR